MTFNDYGEFAQNAKQGDLYVSDMFGTRYVCLDPNDGAPLVLTAWGVRVVFDWRVRGLRQRMKRKTR